MSNPTSNFGWQMPTNTDLVSQLPADFEVFGQAVDTSLADLKGGTTGQVLKKNTDTDMDFVWAADSAGMTNPMTTTGDTIYSSSGSTPARLGIGSTGQVLTVSGGLPSWAAAPGGTWTQAATGSITGASVTVSGLSGKKYFVLLKDYSHNDAGTELVYVQLNGDTGANYYFTGSSSGVSQLQPNYFLSSAAETPTMGFYIDMADTSLPFKPVGGVTINSGAQGGWYNSTSAITSIKFYPSGSSWDGGTYYVWSFS